MNGHIHIRKDGHAGRITLTRPNTLNSLSHEMALAIEAALSGWRDDHSVKLVIIDAQGDRAFCAGGDIEELYSTGKAGDFDYGRQFWTDEYRLNALISEYPKPYLAFMQGFVMGGGVGIGCHGSHRIVGESSRIAMPECGIGLVPDVGGSYLLARAPARLGYYLGLTGARMTGPDAIHAGFADMYVPEGRWESLKNDLCSSGDVSQLDREPGEAVDAPMVELESRASRFFAQPTALACVAELEADDSEWATQSAAAIRRGCPLSVACTHILLAMGARAMTVRDSLANELCFTWRSMSHGEFLEGIRAQIIDKDRKPAWRTGRLEDVTREDIDRMLAPLESNDLTGRKFNG